MSVSRHVYFCAKDVVISSVGGKIVLDEFAKVFLQSVLNEI